MRPVSGLKFGALVLAVYLAGACGRSATEYDSSDFIGTWQGDMTFTVGGEAGTQAVVLTIFPPAGAPTGEFTDDEGRRGIENVVLTTTTIDFEISVPATDDCGTWSVTGTGAFGTTRQQMSLFLSGTFCGDVAGSASGTLEKN
jgi:hypothetical protein